MPRSKKVDPMVKFRLCSAIQAGTACGDPMCKASHFFQPCEVCRKVFYSNTSWQAHIGGLKHKKREAKGLPPTGEALNKPKKKWENPSLCDVCQRYVPDINRHLQTKSHLKQVHFHDMKRLLKESENDKNGVTVNGEFDFDIVELKDATRGVERRGTIGVTGFDVDVTLLEASLSSLTGPKKVRSKLMYVCFFTANLCNISHADYGL
jgi:helicase MOV-10